MYLARVTGAVVASQKQPSLTGQRLLVVRPLDLDGGLRDATEDIALDPGLSAGVGDAVLIAKEGAVVATLLDAHRPDAPPTPANVIIVAVVDEWSVADGPSR